MSNFFTELNRNEKPEFYNVFDIPGNLNVTKLLGPTKDYERHTPHPDKILPECSDPMMWEVRAVANLTSQQFQPLDQVQHLKFIILWNIAIMY